MMLSLLAGMSAAAHADYSTTDDYMAWISDAVCTYHDDPVGYEETIFLMTTVIFWSVEDFPRTKLMSSLISMTRMVTARFVITRARSTL